MPIDLTRALPQVEKMAEHLAEAICPFCGVEMVKIESRLKCPDCHAEGALVTGALPAQADADRGGVA